MTTYNTTNITNAVTLPETVGAVNEATGYILVFIVLCVLTFVVLIAIRRQVEDLGQAAFYSSFVPIMLGALMLAWNQLSMFYYGIFIAYLAITGLLYAFTR